MVGVDLTDVQRIQDQTPHDSGEVSGAGLLLGALLFVWDGDDPELLRLMMTRKGVDLETAVQVFFNGAPERYNMIAKADLPAAAQARCGLLDSIHRRIVCGFYLPDPERGLGLAHSAMQDWINRQDIDGAAGRSGRWVFDREMLDLQMTGPGRAIVRPRTATPASGPALWERLARMVMRDRPARTDTAPDS
jgi:hypothetical protein